MPMIRGLDDLTEFQGAGDLTLMPNGVMRCKKHFDSLVDKLWLPCDHTHRQDLVLPTLAHMKVLQ